MKITYVHQYFKTPQEGGAIRSWYIAKAMVEAGHEVTMITTYNGNSLLQENVDGIKVYYLPIHYSNAFRFRKRLKAFLRFVKKSKELIATLPTPDLLYISSTPLTVGLVGLWAKKKFHNPFIFEVRDLWPEAPVQMGAVKNRFVKRYLYNLEKKIYQRADKIIALSPGMASYIEKLVPKDKVLMVPNMCDLEYFNSDELDQNLIRSKYSLSDAPIITHLGTIGKANHLEYLLAIAAETKKAGSQLQYVIAGDGSEKERLKQLATEQQLDNIHFYPSNDKLFVKELLAISEFTYTSFLNIPILETNSPNKFFDSLASGTPVIVNTKGWLKELVEQHECGFYVDPEKPGAFLEIYEKWKGRDLKGNTLRLANEFDKRISTSKILEYIEE